MEGGKLGLVGDDEAMMTMKMTEECQIDWEHILDDDFFDAGCLWDDDVGVGSTGSVDSWLSDLQHLLFNDDNNNNKELKGDDVELKVDDFQLCDLLLLDSPNPVTCSESDDQDPNLVTNNPNPNSNSNPHNNEIIDVASNSNSNPDNNEFIDAALEVDSKDEDDDDSPLSKKRKRQLRNRDAAMRSRERRKMYVKDLEAKSRYLEAECRRLGRLLECCYAENQMLRFSVHSATTFDGSMAKPESAVLLPETLPLVSLVWLMGLMWLHPVVSLLLLSQDAVAVASFKRKQVENAGVPKRKGAKGIQVWLPLLYLRSKGCKASRTKMKCHFEWIGNTSLSHSTTLVC